MLEEMKKLFDKIIMRVKYMSAETRENELIKYMFMAEAMKIPHVGKKGIASFIKTFLPQQPPENILVALEGKISIRLLNTLHNCGLDTREKILGVRSWADAQKHRNFGKKSFAELQVLQQELAAE